MTLARAGKVRRSRWNRGLRGAAAAFLFAAGAISPATAAGPAIDRIEEGRKIVRLVLTAALSQLGNDVDRSAQEAVFRDLLVTHFDVRRIGRFVAGRAAWSKASPEERKQFLDLFMRYTVKVYSAQLRRYSKADFEIASAGPDRSGVAVVSRIVFSSRSQRPLRIRWRLRPSGGRLKVRDMVFENVSITLSQRREFAAVYRRSGASMAGLFRAMRRKMAELDGR